MHQLLKSLFTEKGFRIYGADDGPMLPAIDSGRDFLAVNRSGRKEYYLVVFAGDIDALQLLNLAKGEFISQCFSSIKQNDTLYEKEMDKNSSIVFCLQSELFAEINLDSASMQKLDLLKKAIYEVEEDPYFFKKYVLTYSNDQTENIVPEIAAAILAGQSVIDYLQTSLNDMDMFKQYKQHPPSQRKYDLICKLFIKLPFLKLVNLEMSTLRKLKDKITEELRQKNLTIDEGRILYLSELQASTFELKDLDALLERLG